MTECKNPDSSEGGNKLLVSILKVLLALSGITLFGSSLFSLYFILGTNFITDHSLINMFDVPETVAVAVLSLASVVLLLIPGLLLLSILRIINLLEEEKSTGK